MDKLFDDCNEIDEDSNLENSSGLFTDSSRGDDDEEEETGKQKRSGGCQPGDSAKICKLFPIFSKHYKPKVNPLTSVQLEVEKTAPKKRKRTMLAKDTDGLTQMVLDAGQKEIGPKYCEECGLLYSPGDFVDEEEHRKAHLRLQNTFSVSLWKDARILFTYPDGCMILMVQCNRDSKRIMNRLRDFLAWLDSELGAGYDPSGTRDSERIFLYVVRTKRKNVIRILGCGIMEIPDSQRITACDLVQSQTESNAASPERSISIGVTRLWTDSGFRNKRIASKILEMMRFNSGIPGCVIAKDQIGILEPSEDGRRCLKAFTNSLGALYTYTS